MMDVERPSLCNCVVNFLLEEKYHLTAFELLHELLEDGRHDQAIRLRDSDRQIQLPQRNIVSTVNLDFKLDLKSIALQARNAEYNPKEGNRRKCNEEKKAVVLTYIGRCCVHLSLHRSSVNPTFTSAQILGLFMRHPSYCGFFIWATGTQLMICNPICALGFTAITWRFFSSRIVYEEFFWKRFFGAHYVEYAQRIPSGLPFIA